MCNVWIIFDDRATHAGTYRSTVLETCHTRSELSAALTVWKQHGAAVYEYDRVGANLINERRIGHVSENARALLARCGKSFNNQIVPEVVR